MINTAKKQNICVSVSISHPTFSAPSPSTSVSDETVKKHPKAVFAPLETHKKNFMCNLYIHKKGDFTFYKMHPSTSCTLTSKKRSKNYNNRNHMCNFSLHDTAYTVRDMCESCSCMSYIPVVLCFKVIFVFNKNLNNLAKWEHSNFIIWCNLVYCNVGTDLVLVVEVVMMTPYTLWFSSAHSQTNKPTIPYNNCRVREHHITLIWAKPFHNHQYDLTALHSNHLR